MSKPEAKVPWTPEKAVDWLAKFLGKHHPGLYRAIRPGSTIVIRSDDTNEAARWAGLHDWNWCGYPLSVREAHR